MQSDSEQDRDQRSKTMKGVQVVKEKKRKKSRKNKQQKKKQKNKSKLKVESIQNQKQHIIEYLKKTNRPYSLINIFDNLHGKIKKPILQTTLQESIPQYIICKEFGKNKVYMINQDIMQEPSKEEMNQMKEVLKDIGEERQDIQQEIKQNQLILKQILSTPTNQQMQQQINNYNQYIQQFNQRIDFYKGQNFIPANQEQVDEVNKQRSRLQKMYKCTKKKVLRIVDDLSSMMQKKVKDLMDEIGIDIQQV